MSQLKADLTNLRAKDASNEEDNDFPEKIELAILELLEVERKSLSALQSIKGWVAFFGILTVISLLLSLIMLVR